VFYHVTYSIQLYTVAVTFLLSLLLAVLREAVEAVAMKQLLDSVQALTASVSPAASPEHSSSSPALDLTLHDYQQAPQEWSDMAASGDVTDYDWFMVHLNFCVSAYSYESWHSTMAGCLVL